MAVPAPAPGDDRAPAGARPDGTDQERQKRRRVGTGAGWLQDQDPELVRLAAQAAMSIKERGWAVVEGVLSQYAFLGRLSNT